MKLPLPGDYQRAPQPALSGRHSLQIIKHVQMHLDHRSGEHGDMPAV
jgi:hypothetical protein